MPQTNSCCAQSKLTHTRYDWTVKSLGEYGYVSKREVIKNDWKSKTEHEWEGKKSI